MNIELFVGGCLLCQQAQEMVEEIKGPQCTLAVYDLSRPEHQAKAAKYGIRAVPTIVGNGRVMFEGLPQKAALVQCSLEHGCRGRRLQGG